MKKLQNKYHLEKGQVLPLVVIMLFVIIGMVALILDGGAIMSNRRTAQAAADAGALAGAKRACLGKTDAKTVAENYATVNHATSATATVSVSGKQVTVLASVEHPSFFAKIFGQQTLKATAEATAGCFPIKGKNVMPIAWSCRRPVTGVTVAPFVPGLGCELMTLDWKDIVEPIIHGGLSKEILPNNSGFFSNNSGTFSTSKTNIVKGVTKVEKVCKMEKGNVIVVEEPVITKEPANEIYIVMDKIPVEGGKYQDIVCKGDPQTDPPSPVIECDINGDGKNDIEGAGNRGWLDLNNGGGGAGDLMKWIDGSKTSQVAPHTWLSGQPGTESSVYQALINSQVGEVVRIPVFNAICPKDITDPRYDPDCMKNAGHASTGIEIDSLPATGNSAMFHVVAFDAFYISCVHKGSGDYCPGFALSQKINTSLLTGTDKKCPESTIPNNTPSVEGYFLTNVEEPTDFTVDCSVNLGNCKVSLIK